MNTLLLCVTIRFTMTTPAERSQNSFEAIFRRMGKPSWLILSTLHPTEALPGIEIIRRVEVLLKHADSPIKTLDPSTFHYAIRRMGDDQLVRCEGEREVDVPGPHGITRREPRHVYVITNLGLQALERERRLRV